MTERERQMIEELDKVPSRYKEEPTAYNEGFDDGYGHGFEHGAMWADKNQKWIMCENMMPEECEDIAITTTITEEFITENVLVVTFGGLYQINHRYRFCKTSKFTWGKYCSPEIIAWMPIPKFNFNKK